LPGIKGIFFLMVDECLPNLPLHSFLEDLQQMAGFAWLPFRLDAVKAYG